jgi:hypothetical protein
MIMNTFDNTTEPLKIEWKPNQRNLFTVEQVENLVSYATCHGKAPLDPLILFAAIHERFNATKTDLVQSLQSVIRRLDNNDPNQYCDDSPQMKAITKAIEQAPESDRLSIDSLLARLLVKRLQEKQ